MILSDGARCSLEICAVGIVDILTAAYLYGLKIWKLESLTCTEIALQKNRIKNYKKSKVMQAKNECSQELRRRVARCYLTSDLSVLEVGRKFGVSGGSVHKWSRKFKSEFTQEAQLRQEITTFGAVTNTPKPMKEKNLTPEQMAARIAELEQKLEHEKMHRIVLDTMIDIAERDLNIAIRKKSGAKQSK